MDLDKKNAKLTDFDSFLEQVTVAAIEIKERHPKGRAQGQLECPRCGKTLFYTIASNMHTSGRCESEGCLNWIE